ncbi:extensin family protein [Fodinicurvata halophila]|uniref:Extensin family protein n=1 Tax=Fodinicurvata halophila TaxID=1419723 RepID=A0ABV8UR57_9PROT
MRLFRSLLLLLLLLGTYALWQGAIEIPERWNPWAPLDVREDPVPLVTGWKLDRLRADDTLCRQALETSQLAYTPVADSEPQPGCPLNDSLRISAAGETDFNSSFVATCPLAVALALYERHSLQPAARETFGQEVSQITHLGSYACRNINNREDGRRSEHASANALDIAAFTLADGRHIEVEADWPHEDDAEDNAAARFLTRAHDGACDVFRVTLGPAHNQAHANHFHLDMGTYSACR